MFANFILPAITLGLSATSIPGPLQAYLLNVTLRVGWRRGLLVVISPLLTDALIVPVVVFLLDGLPPVMIQVIRVLGGLLLLWIAWNALATLRSGANFTPDSATAEADNARLTPRRVLTTSMMMNLLSPGPYLFWTTVNGPLLIEALEISVWHGIAFVVAFYGTFLGGMCVLTLIFDRMGRVNPRVTQGFLVITIVLLTLFGAMLITEGLGLTGLFPLLALGTAIVILGGLLIWRDNRTRKLQP